MNEIVSSTFASIVDDLIELNRSIRSHSDHNSSAMNSMQYLYEFGKVRVDCCRGAGKTEYIISRAKEKDAIVILNDTLRRRISNRIADGVFLTTVSESNHQLYYQKIKRYNVHTDSNDFMNNIYIDDASHLTKDELNNIFSLFAIDVSQTFILLG